MKHTPGPWEAIEYTAHLEVFGRITEGSGIRQRVAFVQDCTIPPEEQRADARLIAAAPELLAACKDMIEGIDRIKANTPTAWTRLREWAGDEATGLMQAISDARAAIAASEGGTED